jgi:hypothetical protein
VGSWSGDIEVQGVQLRAEESKLEIQFSSQNSTPLERFAARVIDGTPRFEHLLNARPKETSLGLPKSECQVEITGKEFEGESAINRLEVPAKMHLLLSSAKFEPARDDCRCRSRALVCRPRHSAEDNPNREPRRPAGSRDWPPVPRQSHFATRTLRVDTAPPDLSFRK